MADRFWLTETILMKKIFFILALFAAGQQAQGQQKQNTAPHSTKHEKPGSSKQHALKKIPIHYGTASFYANKFEGRKTANGEIFSQNKLSAASNIIPLNNWVRITNLKNKRWIILRINDRMHPRNPRLIDLSRLAARRLQYTSLGIVRVKVEILGKRLPARLVKS